MAFANYEHWGDPTILREALDKVWETVDGADIEPNEIKGLEKQCHVVTPHSDDFGSVLDTAGQEASFCVQLALRFCLDQDPKHIAEIASFSRDTIDCFVQDEMDPNPEEPKLIDPQLNERIEGHPLMRQELERQKRDLAYLQQGFDLAKFCQDARKVDKSNIGLSPGPIG